VWPDIKIAWLALMNVVDDGEKVVADGGYWGGGAMLCYSQWLGLNNFDQQKKSDVRVHHS
jgi:hypothetical protein